MDAGLILPPSPALSFGRIEFDQPFDDGVPKYPSTVAKLIR